MVYAGLNPKVNLFSLETLVNTLFIQYILVLFSSFFIGYPSLFYLIVVPFSRLRHYPGPKDANRAQEGRRALWCKART